MAFCPRAYPIENTYLKTLRKKSLHHSVEDNLKPQIIVQYFDYVFDEPKFLYEHLISNL